MALLQKLIVHLDQLVLDQPNDSTISGLKAEAHCAEAHLLRGKNDREARLEAIRNAWRNAQFTGTRHQYLVIGEYRKVLVSQRCAPELIQAFVQLEQDLCEKLTLSPVAV